MADLELPGGVEVAFVRAPLAPARITRLVVPEGVAAMGPDRLNAGLSPLRVAGAGLAETAWLPLSAAGVRFVGEPVAVAWGADRYAAEDAAELVEVEYEEVPSHPVHEQHPDDIAFQRWIGSTEVERLLAGCERVFEKVFTTARQSPLPLEGRAAAAFPDPVTGGLTFWTSTQIPHVVRAALGTALGLPAERVRVLVPHVGGGFGLKTSVYPEEVAVAALALRLGRPARWIEDRRENLLAGTHAHEERIWLRVGTDLQGRVIAVDAEVDVDVGAYQAVPFSASLEPMTTSAALFAPYDLRAIRVRATGRFSPKSPGAAYRGVGTCAAVHATERMMDLIAGELSLDPLEVRRRNLIRELPATSASGRRLDSGDYAAQLARLEEVAGYRDLREEQSRARLEGKLVGIGVAFFNEHSGTGCSNYRERGIDGDFGYDSARIRITETGRLEVYASGIDMGQGLAETLRRVAAERSGVDPELIDVHLGDTDSCPDGSGSFGSRGAVGILEATVRALTQAVERDLEPGTDITVTVDQDQVYPSGAHLAVAEVDPLTLIPRVTRYVAVEDCGRIVDPFAVAGQVRGGVAMGLGDALFEAHVYGEGGQLLTSSLLDYLVPVAASVPEIEIDHTVSPSPKTTLGSKGVGEAGTIGAFAAVACAVADAIGHQGAELTDLPYTPERIHQALERRERPV